MQLIKINRPFVNVPGVIGHVHTLSRNSNSSAENKSKRLTYRRAKCLATHVVTLDVARKKHGEDEDDCTTRQKITTTYQLPKNIGRAYIRTRYVRKRYRTRVLSRCKSKEDSRVRFAKHSSGVTYSCTGLNSLSLSLEPRPLFEFARSVVFAARKGSPRELRALRNTASGNLRFLTS